MTVSSFRAAFVSAQQPLRADTGRELSSPTPGSAFKGEFDDAIKSLWRGKSNDTGHGSATDEEAPSPVAKNEDPPQLPVPVAIVTAIAPAIPPASFGLPSTGVEAGKSVEPTASAGNDEPVVGITPAEPIDPPEPGAKTVQPDSVADLAFALKLADSIPGTETAPKTPVLPPAVVAPEAPSLPDLGVQPASISPPPAIAGAPQQEGAAAESEQHPSDGGHSEQEPPPDAPKPSAVSSSTLSSPTLSSSKLSTLDQQPQSPKPEQRDTGHTPPEVEPRPFHEVAAAPASPGAAHTETPLQTSDPILAVVSVPISNSPEPAVRVAAAPAVEHVPAEPAVVRGRPAPEVNDVSVTLPVPRADSTGEDRIAIRMIQKGAEIHVSVRTPDSDLTQTLRQDLGRLASTLDQAGFHTETWRPGVPAVAASVQSGASQESAQGSPHRDAQGSGSGSGDGEGRGGQGRGGEEQKRKQQDERPRWVAEIEQYKNQ